LTLNLMIVNQWGVWQSSDQRATDLTTLRVLDDTSIKHVAIICPDGTALIAYAGIAWLSKPAGRVIISDWIREILRGELRTVDESLMLLRETASTDIAPFCFSRGVAHMFTIGVVFTNGNPWAVQIRNFEGPEWPPKIFNRFEAHPIEFRDTGTAFMFGPPGSVVDADLDKLFRCAQKKPSDPKQFRKLLASINRRASLQRFSYGLVSENCVVASMPRGGAPISYGVEGSAAISDQSRLPLLAHGIDLTQLRFGLPSLPIGEWESNAPINRLR
jgi:hypothetical protein